MTRPAVFGLLLAIAACAAGERENPPAPQSSAATTTAKPEPAAAQPPTPATASVPSSHLTIRGTQFLAGSAPFEWRGITAFRLAEQLARGQEAAVIAYLDWARDRKLTVVRVLVMAHHLFSLKPAEGIRVLPRLLELAASRNLHVEIVALADTAEIDVDLEQHVRAVGEIAAAHPNALLEIANEPWHPTQDRRLHDPAFTRRLAGLIRAPVPVALGSVERDDGYAAAGYVTWHSPRSAADGGWGHALSAADGAALVNRWQKPVVSDEPIGAAAGFVPGRRDNDPKRFAAAAAVTRLGGLGATFHYEGGLQARIPEGTERLCFDAWSQGLDAAGGVPSGGEFVQGSAVDSIARVHGARAAFARRIDRTVWLLAVDARPDLKVEWIGGWKVEKESRIDGSTLFRGRR